MKSPISILLPLVSASALIAAEPNRDTLSVLDFGAKADGKTDCTEAFQKALDEAGRGGGGVVSAPRGSYLFAGHLSVPRAVTLKGIWESVPSHNGLRDQGGPRP